MTRALEVPTKSPPDRLRRAPMPAWIPPMLATLTDQLPTEGTWVYEPKLDGVRGLIYVSGGTVRIFSRNRKLLNDAYPELVEGLSDAVRGDAVLDGEIVAFDPEHGITSFARLQQRMQLRDPVRARRSQVAVHLYLFDCMYHEGIDLTGLPLLERKAVLKDIVRDADPIRLTPFSTTGAAAQDQVPSPAGARHRRLHCSPGLARTAGGATGGPLRRETAALCGQGRHRIRPPDARTPP